MPVAAKQRAALPPLPHPAPRGRREVARQRGARARSAPRGAWAAGRGRRSGAHRAAAGRQVSRRLEAHPRIRRVHYPGLPSHRDHAIAIEQMSGFGGVISFEARPRWLAAASECWALALAGAHGARAGGQLRVCGQPTVAGRAAQPGRCNGCCW